jgi:hypothetical protein
MHKRHLLTLLLATNACNQATGSASFTTWGEAYIEEEIPADPDGGFVDGWSLSYEKFLVAVHGIKIADSGGEIAAEDTASYVFDNTQPGKKPLVTFTELEAKAWDDVGYEIKPPTASSKLVDATEADRALMIAGGWSIYLEATATKTSTSGTITKHLVLGASTKTRYHDCLQAEESGNAIKGIVVTEGGNDVSELTTHGDHFFYDRLKASPDPAVETVLRFEEKAAADADKDGEITLAELTATTIDVRKYDPSGFDAPNLGAFMTSLARTVGHFRGEGECSLSAAD